MDLINFLNDNRSLQNWQSKFTSLSRQLILGLSGNIKSLIMANAYKNNPKKYVIITDSQYHASELYEELTALLGEEHVSQFFSDDNVYAEYAIASKDRLAYRLAALDFLTDPQKEGFVIVPFLSMRQLLPQVDAFKKTCQVIEVGQEYDLRTLVSLLSHIGYDKTQRVMAPGEFSQRGDILDIYPLDADYPVRIEFFGDEVDGIRFFDVESQRSLQQIDSFEIKAASDFILDDAEFSRGLKKLKEVHEKTTDLKVRSYLEEIIAASKNSHYHRDLRKFSEFFYEKKTSLLDYFPKNIEIFIDDFQKINEMNNKINLELGDFIVGEKNLNHHIDGQEYLADTMPKVRNYKPATFFSNFQKGLGNLRFDAIYNFNQHSMQDFFGQLPLLTAEIARFIKNKYTVVLLASPQKYGKMEEALRDEGLKFKEVAEDNLGKNQVNLISSTVISKGFNFLDEKLVVITEAEIFGKVRKKKIRRSSKISNAERLKDYNELEIGDFVVHKNHGIGKYLGIETIEIGGVHRDYLTIQYQNSDRISVPIDQLDMLTKYTASEGKAPKINKLNDGRWKRTMKTVNKQVEDISDDLIRLYAIRQSQKGFAFLRDEKGESEFDNNFSFVETEDQLRSVNEIKKDMEKDRPMDRLLVGDVGFGKTEVAMRAAFKAVNNHKQVAVLVPTTVLAEQHYKTMLDRFNEFGVEIAVLSRFQTKAQQTKILDDLKKGRIDIIVGTHRILSKDVEFFDLGLMIIDEEQRFGVKHKERLKELKSQVDVLTLTATPIPRTLHMSMLGIRDLSVIETPPTNRYPVQTYVMELNYGVIRDASLREISRGGQVFYLYNRVDTIEQKVNQLSELIPEARIGYVHGQMNEVQLEDTLLDFINGEYDILVTTTIIETGVDIPNANTLFVESADYMGLSQLYQLRGRVGRSNRIAYAYFMYDPSKQLTEVSEKRLDAIKGFTELGSGFKIAMRDLSIRGAGNLLGAEQSGFIESVGFDLYSQLLEESVNNRLGRKNSKPMTSAEINIGIDAFIPSEYITDERQKIEIYKRIREISSREDYENIQDELIDRFGEYPDPVAYLLEVGLLKHYADNALVEKIVKKVDVIIYTMSSLAKNTYLPQDYFDALSKTDLPVKIGDEGGVMVLRFDIKKIKSVNYLTELVNFTERLSEIRDGKQPRKTTAGED
ncbi:transcription-repair coupling factor [Streptococcaceae bacterium ESL0729]|nr:transcription-repair coupling factor [Streptococcaceae bacterium ESL0729]